MSFDRPQLVQDLRRGVEAMALSVDASGQARLLDYLALLVKWNKVYNLTAIRDPREMVAKHLLDSLAILPWVSGTSLADVGSGAGLPGIPLALCRSDLDVTLVETSAKKGRFLRQAILDLGLSNCRVECARVEALRPAAPFALLTARAFATLAEIVALAGHLLATDGQLLALKGHFPEAELAALPAGWRLLGVEPLHVPGLGAERHLVRLTPAP